MRLRYRWCYGVSGIFRHGIPLGFQLANNYVYFDTLSQGLSKNIKLEQDKATLYNTALAATNWFPLDKDSDQVMHAIQFLGTAAEVERNKEIAVIRAYKDKILPRFEDNKDMLQELNSLFNGYTPDNPQQFYEKLIYFLNQVRQDGERVKKRLNELQKGLEKGEDVYKRYFSFSGDSSVRSLINHLNLTSKAWEKNNFTTAVQKATFQILKKKNYEKRFIRACGGKLDLAQFAGYIAAIFSDFSVFLEEEMYKNEKSDLSFKEIEKLANKYMKKTKDQRTDLQKMLSTDMRQVLKISSSIADAYSIKIDDIGEEAKELEEYAVKENKEVMDWLNGFLDQKQIKQLTHLTVSVRTNTTHGLHDEALAEIFTNGYYGGRPKGFGAADSILLGSADVTISTNDEVRDYLDDITQEIERHNNQASKLNREQFLESYQNMNKKVREKKKKLEELLKLLGKQDELFIFHESIKNYKSLETKEHTGFLKGRKMAAEHYIEQLYSVQSNMDYTTLSLPSIDWLIFMVINLFDGCVASSKKDALQDYFSIFAGFLMFDDAIDMAEDARKRLEAEASQVKSIHLYRINNIYIPASYILQSLYQAMMSISNMIDKGISVSIFQEQKKKKDKEEEFKPIEKRWEETGKNTLSSTKVNITFLSAFLQLIEQISSTYGV